MMGLSITTRCSLVTLVAFAMVCVAGCGRSDTDVGPPCEEELIALDLGHPKESEDSSLAMIPVVRVDKMSDMAIQFYVANTSSTPVGYRRGWLGMSHTWHWELLDPATGKPIVSRPNVSTISAREEDVPLIAPGEGVLCSVNLGDFLGDVPPGRYDFHVYYYIHENSSLVELGCEPDEFDRTIMLVDVVEHESDSTTIWVWAAVAGIGFVLLVWYWCRRRKGGCPDDAACE